ncbi:hypothetical protein Prudu_016238 [Prunus dulcis]|uniref:Uncharacterized protein n=1 Tax=Prunus dulcis TaxID=3755 RepID=A0A4Y1RL48_PRUDU|nr:hypothetical protein Prudu_016238 [Prunus dulcis]
MHFNFDALRQNFVSIREFNDRVELGNESGLLHILLLVLQNISAQLQFPSPMTMTFRCSCFESVQMVSSLDRAHLKPNLTPEKKGTNLISMVGVVIMKKELDTTYKLHPFCSQTDNGWHLNFVPPNI